MRKRKHNLGNEGFSLVEILVTLAIISVILLPALAAFSTYNASALGLKDVQRATSLAENVMEIAKTGEFDDYKYSISFTDALDGYSVEESYEADFESYSSKLIKTAVNGTGEQLASCYTDSSGAVQYRNRSDGRYCFVYRNVKDGSSKYDVVVKMTSSGYRNEDKTGYNDMSLSDITGLDSKRTAVISTTTDIEQQAIEQFTTAGVVDAKNKMVMKMRIIVSGGDDTEEGSIKLTAIPTYECSDSTGDDLSWSPGIVFQKTYKTSSSEHLERIYLLYNQMYASVKNNSDEYAFEFDDDSDISNTVPKIYIVRQNSNFSEGRRNLDIFSESGTEYFKEGGFLSDIRGNVNVQNMNGSTLAQVRFEDQDGVRSNNTKSTIVKYKSVDSENILSDDDDVVEPDDYSDNRIYDVSVMVYEAGSDFTKKVTSLSSTRRE